MFRLALAYLAREAPVDEHLVDQLMLPMELAARSGQTSRFRTTQLSEQGRTQQAVLETFLNFEVQSKPMANPPTSRSVESA